MSRFRPFLPSLLASIALLLRSQSTDVRSAGTVAMAKLLRDIFAAQDWKTDPNKTAERAAYYQNVLSAHPDTATGIQARLYYGQVLLQTGRSPASVAELEKLRKLIADRGITVKPDFERELGQTLAMAYLRQGEQQNCQTNHNADSCIYPLRAGGLHKDSAGAQAAIREWTALLQKQPDDQLSRWLLNLAYMAIGQQAPERWRISDKFLDSDYDVGRFVDVAAPAHAALTRHAGGVVAEDFDGDGLFDLVVSSSGPLDQLRYLHNDGNGTFSDQTMAAGLEGEVGGLNVIHADYNNDGRPDLLVLRGGWLGKYGKYPFSLLRNNGPNAKGQITFSDVTVEAGMLSLHPTQTAAWADFDNDGWLDLFVGHESDVHDPNLSELWHNNRDGTFTDIAPQVGLANVGFVKGVAWGDYDGDGRPDLYLSRNAEPNALFHNEGPDKARFWRFSDVTKKAGVADPSLSFATWFFDYDNDGRLDLFVAGYSPQVPEDIPAFHMGLPNRQETPRLYHNNGDGTFTEVAKQLGLNRAIIVMGSGFGDLDNDGWLDCYLGDGIPEYQALLPNRMFRNDGGKRFQDVTKSGGFGNLQKGHAIAFADFNRDGQQDVFEVLGGAYPGDTYITTLLENPGHAGPWMTIKLEGTKSNRAAVGARVAVEVKTPSGTQSYFRTVGMGSSFGDSPLEAHVGLGGAIAIRSVEVRWPSGAVQKFRNLKINSHYALREGESEPHVIAIPAFPFAHEHAGHQHDMTMQ